MIGVVIVLVLGFVAWLLGTEAGRDHVAVLFEGKGAVLVDEIVMAGEPRSFATNEVRALAPYVVTLQGNKRSRMVLARDAHGAATASRGAVISKIECVGFPHRVVQPAPGTWALVVLPPWVAKLIGRPRCPHGHVAPHDVTEAGSSEAASFIQWR